MKKYAVLSAEGKAVSKSNDLVKTARLAQRLGCETLRWNRVIAGWQIIP